MVEKIGNGTSTMSWLKWLVGAVFSLFITAIFFMGGNVIANDNASRDRDSAIAKDVNQKHMYMQQQLVKHEQEASVKWEKVLVGIAQIQTDVKYLKHNGNS